MLQYFILFGYAVIVLATAGMAYAEETWFRTRQHLKGLSVALWVMIGFCFVSLVLLQGHFHLEFANYCPVRRY